MDILRPTRRGFLGGLLAMSVAPAIVSAANIMPIKVFDHYGPNGVLTPEMIAREMARLMVSSGTQPISSHLHVSGDVQSCVDMIRDTRNITMSLENYSERMLRPAAFALSARARRTGIAPGLPRGVDIAAIGEYRGVSVRYVSVYDIRRDQFIDRFDVIHKAA